MMTFASLSASVRALFALWTLLLCLMNIGSGVIGAAQKRYHRSALALGLFVPAYFCWQVIFDFSLVGNTAQAAASSAALCALPWLYLFLALLILTSLAVWLFAYNIRYNKNFITPGTIKVYLDQIPCGICCWQENGHVLFSNICMNELCAALTGTRLLNGNQFREAVKDSILNIDGKVWRFVCREIMLDGERLYEMVASDITHEYAKTRVLEKDKAELARLNTELKEYYLSMDESVKRQEILQAKMNIHDEMNRLMLSTVAADKEDTRALDQIFSLWEQNALLLCMEADKRDEQQESEALDELAHALGITLIWKTDLPSTMNGEQKELFFLTAKEAMVNAVKHAQASTMEIYIESTKDSLLCRFVNHGKMPAGEVHFAGGLANLERLAEKQGAALYAEAGEEFTLYLRF
ncbi:MAG: hypothetical protein IKE65_01560 [Clostridia bacterium]|nr:hypothetical protein [Clostridia bacterium]